MHPNVNLKTASWQLLVSAFGHPRVVVVVVPGGGGGGTLLYCFFFFFNGGPIVGLLRWPSPSQAYKYILTPIGKSIAFLANRTIACVVAVGLGFWK